MDPLHEDLVDLLDKLLDAINEHEVKIDLGVPGEEADLELYDIAAAIEEELEALTP